MIIERFLFYFNYYCVLLLLIISKNTHFSFNQMLNFSHINQKNHYFLMILVNSFVLPYYSTLFGKIILIAHPFFTCLGFKFKFRN